MMHGGMMHGGMMHEGMMTGMCPMSVPGTTVQAVEAEGGAALAFTTQKSDQVGELRSRLQRMATMHNGGHMMSAGMMTHGGGTNGGMMMGAGMAGMPVSTATAEDIDGGARLVLKPKDPAELEVLRAHVKEHAEQMQQGACPMMAAQNDASGADSK